MTYYQALSMKHDLIAAIQYEKAFPGRPIEVAKKYTVEQWKEMAEALVKKLDEESETVIDLLKYALMARQIDKVSGDKNIVEEDV